MVQLVSCIRLFFVRKGAIIRAKRWKRRELHAGIFLFTTQRKKIKKFEEIAGVKRVQIPITNAPKLDK